MKKIFLLATLAFSLNAIAQIPTNGLVGYYPFTGNANDQSGNNNNGIVTNATLVSDRYGNANSAYSFNGTNTFISVPHDSSIAYFPNGQTISMWLKISSYPTNGKENILIDKRDNTNKYYQVFLSDFSNVDWAVYRFGESAAVSSQANNINFSSLPLNQWFNLTYTTNLDTTKSFLNGILMNTFISTSLIGFNTDSLLFGKSNQGFSTDDFYNGLLDDIRIYNRPLNMTEVSSLYNEGLCYQFITVTDTLLINTTITGFNPITYQNTIKVWPNPTHDHITIDNGNIANLTGYQIKITNSLSQQVFQSNITQQQFYVDLTTWTGNGIYFVHIIDGQGNTIDIKKIVLQ